MLTIIFNDRAFDFVIYTEEESDGSEGKSKTKGRDLTKYTSRMERAVQLFKEGEYGKAMDQILKILESNAALLDSRRDKCCDMLVEIMDEVVRKRDWNTFEELKRKLGRNGLVFTAEQPNKVPRHRPPVLPPAPSPKWRGRI